MKSPNWICIDFTRTRGGNVDVLTDFGALVDWAERSGVVPGDVIRALRERAQADPAGAVDAYAAAIRLRESVYEVLKAVSEGRSSDPVQMDRLNDAVRLAAAHRGIVEGPEGYEWMWLEEESVAFEQLLWPVAQSAAELLTSDWISRLGLCDADGCGWLFVDKSRNRSRRWCDMADCGNVAKVRRFRERARAGQPNPGV